ncbi:MAG: serpin family protein [Candidatus Coatesbacteria bacterium]|nr:serpin family protein [Candidatus Coatesbacteria bacterium]
MNAIIKSFLFFVLTMVSLLYADIKLVDENVKKAVESSNSFGINLLKEIIKRDNGKNIFISPASISICMSMVYNGADGKTREEMGNAMQLGGLNPEIVSKSFGGLIKKTVVSDKDTELLIANSIWLKKGMEFRKDYLDDISGFYKARLDNFTTDPKPINDWVSENTKGLIKKVIDDVKASLCVIVNTVYFKSEWKYKFDKSLTRDADFMTTKGKKKHKQMISDDLSLRYFRGEHFQSVSLPYKGDRLSLVLFLPDQDYSLEKFQSDINSYNYEKWISSMRTKLVQIYMPKLKLTYNIDNLKDDLEPMGMKTAFTNDAQFSRMSVFPLKISRIIHKTYLELNEEKTEAAAVTAIDMPAGCAPEKEPPKPIVLVFDRPYFFVIKDNSTNLILFMGSIAEPVEE